MEEGEWTTTGAEYFQALVVSLVSFGTGGQRRQILVAMTKFVSESFVKTYYLEYFWKDFTFWIYIHPSSWENSSKW